MEKHFKQLIIARRDLNMSPGKLAAQVSSAFLIEILGQRKYKTFIKSIIDQIKMFMITGLTTE